MTARFERGNNAQANSEHRANEGACQRQLDRHPQALEHHVQHQSTTEERATEIPVDDASKELDSVEGDRTVGPEIVAQARLRCRIGHPHARNRFRGYCGWLAERSNAWMVRFRRLARDYERLPQTPAGLHVLALAIGMAQRFIAFMVQRP